MPQLIEIPLDDTGAVVQVEVADESPEERLDGGYDRATSQKVPEFIDAAGRSVRSALEEVICPTVRVVHDQLRQLSPRTVEVEFGVKLSAKAGAVIASSEVECNLKIKMTWGGVPEQLPVGPDERTPADDGG